MYEYSIICQYQQSFGLVVLDATDNALRKEKGPQQYCPNFYIDIGVSYLHHGDFQDRDCLLIIALILEADVFSEEPTKTRECVVYVLWKQRVFK